MALRKRRGKKPAIRRRFGRTAARWAFLWIAAAFPLILAKWETLRDPPYWDAIGCYLPQARFLMRAGFDAAAYHELAYVRPPVLTAVVGTLLHFFASRAVVHGMLVLWAALALPATLAIALRFFSGIGPGWAVLSALLCAATPLYFAQAGLVQTDLPAAALVAIAWAAILSGRRLLFVLCATLAVLTKESSYFICLPAAVLLFLRAGRRLTALPRVFPAGIPILVLAAWLLLHRYLTGHFIAKDHAVMMFSKSAFGSALLHNFVEGGRLPLVFCAALGVQEAWRWPEGEARWAVLTSALAVLVLPFCFPADMPRYMLLSLPMLCALAALGISMMPRVYAVGTAVLVLGLLGLGWRGLSWHMNGGYHLESNLTYRELLGNQRKAAEFIAGLHPRGVLAAFPMGDILNAPPDDGYLKEPLPSRPLRGNETLSELCQSELLVDANGVSMEPALRTLREHSALTLIKQFPTIKSAIWIPPWARTDLAIRIYRIACP
jgi:hypothetical protein